VSRGKVASKRLSIFSAVLLVLAALVAWAVLLAPVAALAQTISNPSGFNASTSVQQRARRILDNTRRAPGDLLAVMGTPPTRSSAAFANSTISSRAPGDAMFKPDNTTVFDPISQAFANESGSYVVRGPTQNPPARTGAYGSGVQFCTDAQTVDFEMQRGAAFAKYMIYVTDLTTGVRARITADDIPPGANDYGWQWDKLAFAAKGPRKFEVYTVGANTYRGSNIEASASIWKCTRDEPRLGIVGDSWVMGTISGGDANKIVKTSYPDWLANSLGLNNFIRLAMNGTGYLNSNGEGNNHLQRIQNGDADVSRVGELDLIVAYTGVNDSTNRNAAFTDALVAANVQAFVTLLMQKQPKAIIVIAGPQWSTGFPSTQARYDAFKAAVTAAAAGDPRVIYLDNSPSGENWINANNIGTLLGPDALHPGDGKMIARIAADSLIRRLTTLAGQ
jgi:hypothetical protein